MLLLTFDIVTVIEVLPCTTTTSSSSSRRRNRNRNRNSNNNSNTYGSSEKK